VSAIKISIFAHAVEWDRGAGAQEKWGRKREKGVWEAGFLRWQEPVETCKILQHFVKFCNRYGTKRRERL